ncbi:MAG: hypothetical protein QOI80_3387 [Solirubrobacteraceae bacterium]|jgi:hypothetical protein|nr:hypothetical protein [Solirubrobacteraceae bacterium]
MVEPSDMLRLVLEVEREVDPIRGTVADSCGPARPYVGWVALIGALDELRSAPATEEPCTDAREP